MLDTPRSHWHWQQEQICLCSLILKIASNKPLSYCNYWSWWLGSGGFWEAVCKNICLKFFPKHVYPSRPLRAHVLKIERQLVRHHCICICADKKNVSILCCVILFWGFHTYIWIFTGLVQVSLTQERKGQLEELYELKWAQNKPPKLETKRTHFKNRFFLTRRWHFGKLCSISFPKMNLPSQTGGPEQRRVWKGRTSSVAWGNNLQFH